MGSAVQDEANENDRGQTEFEPYPQGNEKPLEIFK